MRPFARLLERLHERRERTEQALHLRHYLHTVPPADAAAAVHLLVGGRAGPRLPAALLAATAARAAQLPDGLFDACRRAAGDLAEAIALAVPSPRDPDDGLLGDWLHHRLPALHALPANEQADQLTAAWPTLSPGARRVLAELLQGGLQRAPGADVMAALLAQALDLDPGRVAHRLARFGTAPAAASLAAASLTALVAPAQADEPLPTPFAPMCIASAAPPPVAERWIGWCPDGLRAQLVRRGTEVALWDETQQRLNPRFLDVVEAAQAALPPDTVLDGWLVAPGRGLASRLAARPLSRAAQAREPVRFVVLDAPRWAGAALSQQPLRTRLARLSDHLGGALTAATALAITGTPPDTAALLHHHAHARRHRAAGLLWADLDATGPWTCWPLAPLTAQVVLVYAEAGPHDHQHFSFAVHGPAGWTTVARLPAHATGGWAAQLGDQVRGSTVRRIGPIQEVTPERVYELAFDALDESPRHKCGLVLRGARLLRPRDDLAAPQADTLARLQALLQDSAHAENAPLLR